MWGILALQRIFMPHYSLSLYTTNLKSVWNHKFEKYNILPISGLSSVILIEWKEGLDMFQDLRASLS